MATYASLPVLKAFVRKTQDDEDDVLLQQALDGSVRSINDTTGRPDGFFLATSRSQREFSPYGKTYVDAQARETVLFVDDIGDYPGTGGNAVQVLADGVDITSRVKPFPRNAIAHGEAVEGLILKREDWRAYEEILVSARWGWPSVPYTIVEANKIQASRLYRRKDSPEGTTGTAEWGIIRVPAMDPDVRNMIKFYIKMVTG